MKKDCKNCWWYEDEVCDEWCHFKTWKPAKNKDMIMRASEEELAAWLAEITSSDALMWREWLNQEVVCEE